MEATAEKITALATGLRHHTEALTAALAGLTEDVQRRSYAHLLLCRLILIQTLQRRGFLPGGDRWYLQTRLGHCQEQGRDRSFHHLLLPLCLQGFGLPLAERSPAFTDEFGPLPYLGSALFEPQPWEQFPPSIHLPDEPLEDLLAWMAEQAWPSSSDEGALSLAAGAIALELWWRDLEDPGAVWPPQALEAQVEGAIAQGIQGLLLSDGATPGEIQGEGQGVAEPHGPPPHRSHPHLDAVLTAVPSRISALLPRLTVLDPACGSGRILVAALGGLQRLYAHCWQQAQTAQHPDLLAWGQRFKGPAPTIAWAQTVEILTRHLYGVDLRPEAIALTQCQLYLALLATTDPQRGLAPLPPLTFNLMPGNSLVGLIRVDEATFAHSPTRPAADTAIQGNLLSPLAAENYRTLLSEKQIRIEHYRAQTQILGEGHGVPPYARTAFLRDRIEALSQATQLKLNQLLLDEFSQQLGLRWRSPHPSDRPRHRLLTPEDIAALHPLHWGFHFSHLFQGQGAGPGGFTVVVTQPPGGTLRPTVEEFYALYAPELQALGLDLKTFRRRRRYYLQRSPALAVAWTTYASPILLLGDYIRRSRHYQPLDPAPMTPTQSRALYYRALFARRCADLCSPAGVVRLLDPRPPSSGGDSPGAATI